MRPDRRWSRARLSRLACTLALFGAVAVAPGPCARGDEPGDSEAKRAEVRRSLAATGEFLYALALDFGIGARKDPVASASWYRKAAANDNDEARAAAERLGSR